MVLAVADFSLSRPVGKLVLKSLTSKFRLTFRGSGVSAGPDVFQISKEEPDDFTTLDLVSLSLKLI
jgi:hypothetical protein